MQILVQWIFSPFFIKQIFISIMWCTQFSKKYRGDFLSFVLNIGKNQNTVNTYKYIYICSTRQKCLPFINYYQTFLLSKREQHVLLYYCSLFGNKHEYQLYTRLVVRLGKSLQIVSTKQSLVSHLSILLITIVKNGCVNGIL